MTEYEKSRQKVLKELEELDADYKYGTKNNKDEYLESIYGLDNVVATALYIIVMVVGSIFLDRFVIYIGATIIFVLFKTRFKRRKK